MDGLEEFEDYLRDNPNAGHAELQGKMQEIAARCGSESMSEMESALDEHLEDYQSGPEDFGWDY